MRRLVLLVGAIVLVDGIFFAVLVPLLPHYAETLDLSKSEAGVLNAAYAAGALTAAVPGGLIASRVGVKSTVLLGLVVISTTSIVFGLAASTWVLDVARFGQGVGSAISWTGALGWLVAYAAPERRGELIGVAMAAAVAGALLGPVLGGGAAVVGTGPAFTAVALVGVALIGWTWTTPAPISQRRQPVRALFAAVLEPRVAAGLWFLTLPALLIGVLSVLAPLDLDRLGWDALAIGAIFLVAAALGAVLNPFLGRWSDRRGRIAPVQAGLAASIAVSIALPWIAEPWTLATLVVAAGVAYGVFWVPGTALLADGAEAANLDQVFGFALMNLAWAPGHLIGSAVGGALADATGDAVPYVLLAAACCATLIAVRHSQLGKQPGFSGTSA